MRYAGTATICKYDAFNVDSSGRATLAATGYSTQEFPIFVPENMDTVIQGNSPIWYICTAAEVPMFWVDWLPGCRGYLHC